MTRLVQASGPWFVLVMICRGYEWLSVAPTTDGRPPSFRILCCPLECPLGKTANHHLRIQIVYADFLCGQRKNSEQNKNHQMITVRVTRQDPPMILLAHYRWPSQRPPVMLIFQIFFGVDY